VSPQTPTLPHARTLARWLPYLALVAGIIGLGFSGIFVRWANAPGAVSGFYRVAIALAVMTLPALHQARAEAARRAPAPGSAAGAGLGRPAAPTAPAGALFSRRHLALAALSGLLFAGDLAAWNTSILMTSAANSTLLANTSPLWVGLGALLLFRERLRGMFWGGLLLAMGGAAVILGQDYLTHPTLGAGDLLALLAGFFYGGYFLAMQRAREALSPLVAWWVSAATSALGLLVLAMALGQPLTGYPPATWLNLAAVALVTQVGAYVSISYALGHLPASLVAPTLLGQPVLTALLAVPLLGEPLDWVQVAGGALVLSGIYIVHRARRAR
jgi:drug/metabolite transporter (DMT)-like permease